MVFIIFIVSGLFNATGIGGGSLFVAYLISVLKYPTKTAIGISYSVLFGGSLAKTSFSIRLRNDESKKPLINYDVAMILIPAMLVGSIVGLYLNEMFPDLLILMVMTILLLLALFKIYKKAVNRRLQEIEENKKEKKMVRGDTDL